jgi:hypothetical protein
MATPTNLPAAQTTGAVLTAAYMNDLRGAFRVLQVVTAAATTQVTNTTSTFADTGLTASITPQSTSSKILVYVSQGVQTGTATVQEIRTVRGSTTVDTFGHTLLNDGSLTIAYGTFISFDSPSSTSALTYKTQFRRIAGTGTCVVQYNDANGIQRSTIVLMEISA